MSRQKIEYLIVGQGVAGTTLAYTFLKNGHQILVVDNQNPCASSRVAAGLFNPITGKRMLKTWKADVLFPYFFDFYQELESVLGSRFFFQIPMFRPFHSTAQQNAWLAESAEKENLPYISRDVKPHEIAHVHAPLGGLELRKTGYVNLPVLLSDFRTFLTQRSAFLEENFDDAEIIFKDDKVIWKDYEVERIIFCRGFQDAESQWFSWLPFRPTQGDILDLRLEKNMAQIINKKCWVIPNGNQIHRVGSTYDLHRLDYVPHEKSKQDILERFEAVIDLNYEIVAHQASIRPTTADRRLFMGLHPENQRIVLFNGLGTKGVSQAPYFANMLYQFLEKNKEIMPEVDIQRYEKFYFTK